MVERVTVNHYVPGSIPGGGVMLTFVDTFNSNFYFKYKLPDFDVLMERLHEVEDKISPDNVRSWGNLCSLETVSEEQMRQVNFSDIISNAIELLANDLRTELKYNVFHPWLNQYKRGDHQEAHIHDNCDVAAVIFLNQGENFGKFYFLDSNAAVLSRPWVPIMANLIGKDPIHFVQDIEPGDIIFFPNNMFHGVTPHRSDEARKTIAFNIIIEGINIPEITDENN
ncbi:2OG-Fe(II) oxygenase [Synechococcus phage ACG-2014h]|uniref:Uncharacterized protein n=1 Tax=Synechococcus phage ACG-2014h TaxID=1340810 RepID=V5US23_9CAUD|nr:2OG-Fe(II) oxygenase [Synechococcus phage ACG-2014h]AHB80438.1 hypothetical protein S-MbCM7_024 [Synechococcus phage ACG-2014h]